MGQGLLSVLKQGVAEALGVKPEKVLLIRLTLILVLECGNTCQRDRSWQNVTIRAANELRSQIFEHANLCFHHGR